MRLLLTTIVLSSMISVSCGADQIKVLIVDGVNNHDWELTTEATKATLEQTGRFSVDVSTSPRQRAPKTEWKAYRPRFFDYHVVIGNFNNDCEEEDGCDPLWSPQTMADFERFVREGGGFVLIHGADNSWADWPEYNEMTGMGGWGGREAGKSGYLLRKKGRVFHIPLGHDEMEGDEDEEEDQEGGTAGEEHESSGTALHCVGYQTVLRRGTEYVATGNVAIGIPDSFPTKEKAVVIAPDELKWPARASQRGETTSRRSAFTKQVEVFGLHVYATDTTGDDKVLHAANVLAEYIDNDEDGVPDNPKIMQALLDGKGAIVMRKTEKERTTGPRPRGQGLYDEETVPNARAQGRFDGALEEVLHMVTDIGWAGAYPEVFGREPGTKISNALDNARGGRFMETPDEYPDGAWFTYDDETCDYDCMNSEYIYWVLTSILGGQDFPGRYEQIKDEWRLNTRAKVREGDPAAYALFTNPRYKLPTVLPDGKYRAHRFTIQEYP